MRIEIDEIYAMENTSIGDTTVCTTCPYCGVGCGVDVKMLNGKPDGVCGTTKHPANLGRLCVKGSSLHETLGVKGRLLRPNINGKDVSWDDALAYVAKGFSDTIREYGPDSVAFYVSGQLLTEDYYVANKLMKGFIGSANIDTNSRLCMSSAVAGYKRAFGSDTVPCDYTDLEEAELLVISGSNAAWAHPVLYQRVEAAKAANPRMRIVTIDPRKTATAELSDLHLSLAPGTDTLLLSGLLHFLSTNGKVDKAFTRQHCEGLEQALDMAAQYASEIETVARGTGLRVEDIRQFYQWFAETEKTVSFYSQGLNQSSTGSDNSNAVINCHLATGRIGRAGMGPFSITGQPNAMGGREVGGLANQLAAHMDFTDASSIELVRTFWQAPNMATQPGLKAVDLFDAIDAGDVKAVWVMGTNPAVSLPHADQVTETLARCELLVVSDCEAATDTTVCADVLLPATGWGEKDGTVTNSERRISRQRAFMPPTGEAKSDWWIIAQVAQRMGFEDGFNYSSNAEIFREHAALSGFQNEGSRDFDISALQSISDADYEKLSPVQWPCLPGDEELKTRLFADGRFYTPSGKALFVAIEPKQPESSSEYPFIFNTGRARDQWHTMTRTAKAPRLLQHIDEPYIEIHPTDANKYSLEPSQLMKVVGENGSQYIGRARINEDQRSGSVFSPIHWNRQFSASAKASAVTHKKTDALSGQPAFKHSSVKLQVMDVAWQACIVSAQATPYVPDCEYWTKIPQGRTQRLELAGSIIVDDVENMLAKASGANGVWVSYNAPREGCYRAMCTLGETVQALVFYSTGAALPARGSIATLFNSLVDSQAKRAVMSGDLSAYVDAGRTICACHNVGENTIRKAIEEDGLDSTLVLGEKLKCGTRCGSCLPDLNAILASYTCDVA